MSTVTLQVKCTMPIIKMACEPDRVQEYLPCSNERNKIPLLRHFMINAAAGVKAHDKLTSALMDLIQETQVINHYTLEIEIILKQEQFLSSKNAVQGSLHILSDRVTV